MADRILSNWIQTYLDYTKYSEAPQKFHFWTAVSTLAGAMRRRVWIDQAYFQWTPNFYVVFVAPPGIVSKSTTASIGMRLLKQVPDVKFGPDAVTWQALTESLAGSMEDVPDPLNDSLSYPMSCITISSSEFGTFLNPSDREMVDVLVSLWDGQLGTWEKATKMSGNDSILNPWINMIACTTPSWIADNFPDYMIGGGFSSRCVYVYAEAKRHLVAYPGQQVPQELYETEEKLVRDLIHISTLVGEYKLTPNALAYGEQWYAEHYAETHAMTDSKAIGYRARKQTHIHKLAMVIAASRSDELLIRTAHLKEAAVIVTQLEEEMPKVFALIGRTASAAYVQAVVDMIGNQGVIPQAVLVKTLSQSMSLKEITEGIDTALAGEQIRRFTDKGKVLYAGESFKLPSEM